jgi:hypothetical protein
MVPCPANGEGFCNQKVFCIEKRCIHNTQKTKSSTSNQAAEACVPPLTKPRTRHSKSSSTPVLHLFIGYNRPPFILRGGCAEPEPWDENRPEKIQKELEEIRKFAVTNNLPIPSDDPNAVDLGTLRKLFPGGGDKGLDDPRLRYLAQLLPAIEERTGAETDELLWPGDGVVVSPHNPHGPPYNATVADLPLILALEQPCDAQARRYHYMHFQHRFETADPQPHVLTEEEFLQRFYPDLDRSG